MTKRDDLMFFEDFEDDVKPAEPAPVPKPPTKTPSKKPESRPISKNILMQNDEPDYDTTYAQYSSKPSGPGQEKKEIIWEPGSNNRKNREKLPELTKNNVEIKKQINIESQHKPQRRESPARQSDQEPQQEEQTNKQQKRVASRRIKLSDRKQKPSDDEQEFDQIDLSPKQPSNTKMRNVLEERDELPKHEQTKKGAKKNDPKHEQKQSPMPQLNSDSDTEHVPVTTIKDNNPAVEIRLESDPLKSVNIADISNRREFLTMPIPEGKQLQCTIKREKGSLGLFPQYDVFLSNEYRYLMSAKKRSGNATSNYLITADKNDMETNSTNYLGKVRSNFMGTCFQIYDDGCNPDKVETGKKSRKILSSVHYASNIFGSKGPRKMEVYVPDPAKNPATVPDRDLKEHWEKDPNSFVQLLNKPPKWNELKQIYMLDFKGRVDKPSVKNFILTYKDQEEPLILLFGRVGEDVFHLDLMYPLSPVQALGIVMTSFDTKLACE